MEERNDCGCKDGYLCPRHRVSMAEHIKTFPIIKADRGYKGAAAPRRIPWSVAEKAYMAYAARYGTEQSMERMAERGGFGVEEMDVFYPPWRDEVSEINILRAALRDLAKVADQVWIRLERDWHWTKELWPPLCHALDLVRELPLPPPDMPSRSWPKDYAGQVLPLPKLLSDATKAVRMLGDSPLLRDMEATLAVDATDRGTTRTVIEDVITVLRACPELKRLQGHDLAVLEKRIRGLVEE